MALLLVNCSQCRTPLQLPPGATVIRCALCQAVTSVSAPREGGVSHPGYQAPPAPYHQGAPSGVQLYGQPAPTQYAPAPPQAHGQKRAVIVGISYRYTRHELKGCLNDAKCMRYMLINRFKFPESSILMLTEDEVDPLRKPIRHNILMALHWLVLGNKAGDSLLFHFSGHGSQTPNYRGEEADGYDETLCPQDFTTAGMIVDDEINERIVRPLVPGARLHAIIDSCHSGTVLDLPYLCRFNRMGQFQWEDHRPRSGKWTGTSGGQAYSFSGCDDNQTSADTSALSQITSTGAMTFCFIQAVERGAATYGAVLNAMRYAIREADSKLSSGGPVSSLLEMLLTGGSYSRMNQEPQLTSSDMFDINSHFYL